MTKQIMAALAVGITLFSASAGMAQQKPATHKPAVKAAAKTVYVCTECKDSMGHKLTKMAKTPTGFTDGSKSTM